ncbi:hypothetical protein CVV67_07695 [Arthrobacter stackebrandtii]|nr:hypothetical protein CVV67_07695 [Arthrobacter stackebrandtii]
MGEDSRRTRPPAAAWRPALAATLAFGMALAGCSAAGETGTGVVRSVAARAGDGPASDPPAAETTAAAPETSSEPAPGRSPAPTPGPPAATTKPAGATAVPVPSACLKGKWQLKNETFADVLNSIMQEAEEVPAEFKLDVGVTGESLMHFGDDGFYGQSLENFSIVMGAGAAQATHVQSSAHSGSYEATDEHVQISGLDELFFDATMKVGEEVTVVASSSEAGAAVSVFGYTALVPGMDTSAADGVARYSCTGAVLTLESDGGGSAQFSRVG